MMHPNEEYLPIIISTEKKYRYLRYQTSYLPHSKKYTSTAYTVHYFSMIKSLTFHVKYFSFRILHEILLSRYTNISTYAMSLTSLTYNLGSGGVLDRVFHASYSYGKILESLAMTTQPPTPNLLL